MVVHPTIDTVRAWSQKKLTPLIESTPALARLFGPSQKNPRNKLMHKEFPGGFLKLAYSTSAVQLRSDAIKRLVLDEIDGFPDDVDGEGDPVELAMARTRTFRDQRKVFAVSTPTVRGYSRIDRMYEEGDQRQYHVPCPHCGHRFQLELEYLERVSPTEVGCTCPECRKILAESAKSDLLEQGEWVPTAESTDPTVRSYYLSALYSPAGWYSWHDVLTDYEKARTADDANALRVFWNTVLGLSFADVQSESIDWRPLFLRRGAHEREWVPAGVGVLTAGADVQGDRIEVEVVGWGKGLRSWSIDYLVLHGDPTQLDVWEQLDELLERPWSGVDGGLYQISRLAIDSGYCAQDVYRWTARVGPRLAAATRGASHSLPLLVAAPESVEVDVNGKKMDIGAQVRRLNTVALKDHIKRWLELAPSLDAETPRRWCEFPDYPRSYFEQLCIEKRVAKGASIDWVCAKNDRNEPWDCRVYATAAAIMLGLDRWEDDRWDRQLREIRVTAQAGGEIGTVIPPSRAVVEDKDGKRKRRSSPSPWLKR
jgi:phage terminase large subunit GpA-like protein